MYKPRDPRELAVDLLPRSTCSIKCAAVIADKWGILSWGSNHVGFDGFGQHAEAEAIRRSNRKRLKGATIYVAAERTRNGKSVPARPCMDCFRLICKNEIKRVWFRDNDNKWKELAGYVEVNYE